MSEAALLALAAAAFEFAKKHPELIEAVMDLVEGKQVDSNVVLRNLMVLASDVEMKRELGQP